MFLIIPFPNPSDSVASTEVRQEQRQPLSKVSLSGEAGCLGNDLPSHCSLLSSDSFVHSGILCPYSMICFSQHGSWCDPHKHIWKNTLEIERICENTRLFFLSFTSFWLKWITLSSLPTWISFVVFSLSLLFFKLKHNNLKMP